MKAKEIHKVFHSTRFGRDSKWEDCNFDYISWYEIISRNINNDDLRDIIETNHPRFYEYQITMLSTNIKEFFDTMYEALQKELFKRKFLEELK